jgi:hypothetical protein
VDVPLTYVVVPPLQHALPLHVASLLQPPHHFHDAQEDSVKLDAAQLEVVIEQGLVKHWVQGLYPWML